MQCMIHQYVWKQFNKMQQREKRGEKKKKREKNEERGEWRYQRHEECTAFFHLQNIIQLHEITLNERAVVEFKCQYHVNI